MTIVGEINEMRAERGDDRDSRVHQPRAGLLRLYIRGEAGERAGQELNRIETEYRENNIGDRDDRADHRREEHAVSDERRRVDRDVLR